MIQPSHGFRRLVVAGALAVAPLAGFGLGMLPAVALAEAEAATCKAFAVLAKKDGDGKLPPELEFLAEELGSDQFAAYKSFRLLDSKRYELEKGKARSERFKSGHRVALELLGGEVERPRVRIGVWPATGDKPLVSADYTIQSSGFLLLAGFKHEEGRVIFAIQCSGT